jgi:surface antigen
LGIALLALLAAACSSSRGLSPEEVERGAAAKPIERPEPTAAQRVDPPRVETVALSGGKPSVLNGLLSSEIGKQLSVADHTALTRATQTTLETVPIGTQSNWRNADSGNAGTVTPTRTYQKANGQYCREFTQRIEIKGRGQEAAGTACRESDGAWTLVEG